MLNCTARGGNRHKSEYKRLYIFGAAGATWVMQTFPPASPQASAVAIDLATIVNHLNSVKEARALPCGTVVGDSQGGLTFSDAVASALEARSQTGWREVHTGSGETWTIILLDR